MKKEAIMELKENANPAKMRLISIMYDLEEIGAPKSDIDQLNRIIERLEAWQNK